MVPLTALLVPTLVAAVFVFIVSSIIHMATPMHKKDCRKMPNEDKVLDAIRANAVPPGEYMFPAANSMKEMSTPEMKAKLERGPVGSLVVRPACFGMGKSLLQWFVYCLVIGFFAGYTGSHALGKGADYLRVFQVIGAAAVGMYAFAAVPNSIWKGISWSSTLKFVVDGIIYGLVTAGTFGWLWPKA